MPETFKAAHLAPVLLNLRPALELNLFAQPSCPDWCFHRQFNCEASTRVLVLTHNWGRAWKCTWLTTKWVFVVILLNIMFYTEEHHRLKTKQVNRLDGNLDSFLTGLLCRKAPQIDWNMQILVNFSQFKMKWGKIIPSVFFSLMLRFVAPAIS